LIECLRIRDLAVVEQAELEFGPGLNVVTGETGAGKSIVLGALSLLAGGRASTDSVRRGAEEAVVEAVFRTDALPALEAELARRGLGVDGHELVVRRVVSRSGRGRAQLAGQLVPVSLLAELFAGRVEISSQHESQALLRPETQLLLLDAFAEALGAREEVAAGHARLRALAAEAATLRGEAAERARRQDFLAFQVREIDEAKLREGERDRLGAERARLAHAERLVEDTAAAAALLSGDGLEPEDSGAAARTAAAARHLEAAGRIDPELSGLGARLRAAQTELEEVAREAAGYAESAEADPERLGGVEERLALLERLFRKYGADETETLAFRDRAAAELSALESVGSRLEAVESERERAAAGLAEAAARLGALRRDAAGRLAGRLEEALQPLVEGARIEVALEPAGAGGDAPCGPTGGESVELRFAVSRGEQARPLRRVASGGELSRVFLALKNVLRRGEPGMVLVFDEVDAGVGGRVAERVGRALAELAHGHQVLCITHLPQIAAQGATHFRVVKEEASGRSSGAVLRLLGPERVDELARMAGGEIVGEATRRHAAELLRAGGGEASAPREARPADRDREAGGGTRRRRRPRPPSD